MKINKINYIFFVGIIVHSLYGMEKPVSCAKMCNLVNIVPEVKAPLAVGCINKDFIIAQEEKEFTVWNKTTKESLIKKAQEKEILYDFAISKDGLIAFSNSDGVEVWDTLGKVKNSYKIPLDFLPIVFNSNNDVMGYDKQNKGTILCSQSRINRARWAKALPNANNLFTHHPSRKQFIFAVDYHNAFVCGYYGDEGRWVWTRFLSEEPNVRRTIGQLYNNDGSAIAIIGKDKNVTYVSFHPVDATSHVCIMKSDKKSIYLSTECIAMVFHPNNKLFFLLDIKNTIYCFDNKTKELIHKISCQGEKDIPFQGLQKRLAISSSGNSLFGAFAHKVVKIPLNETKKLIFILKSLMQYDHQLLPIEIIRLIVSNALANLPLLGYFKE